MKYIFYVLILIFSCKQATSQPQLCYQIVNFNDCVNKSSLKVAGCSGLVKSVPTQAFYDCQCQAYTEQQSCYSYCPDDPQLQLQLVTMMANANSICKASTDMKLINSSTTTTTPSVTKTPVLPTFSTLPNMTNQSGNSFPVNNNINSTTGTNTNGINNSTTINGPNDSHDSHGNLNLNSSYKYSVSIALVFMLTFFVVMLS